MNWRGGWRRTERWSAKRHNGKAKVLEEQGDEGTASAGAGEAVAQALRTAAMEHTPAVEYPPHTTWRKGNGGRGRVLGDVRGCAVRDGRGTPLGLAFTLCAG